MDPSMLDANISMQRLLCSMNYHRALRILHTVFVSAVFFVVPGCNGGGGGSGATTPPVNWSTATFPLHVESGKRYLIDSANAPFLMHGDSAWSLIAELTREKADQYLEDRRKRGFNTILVNLLEHKFSKNAPKNAYGDSPFIVPGDFSTPNDAYFTHVDWIIQKAADKGMLVLLTPAYLGYGGGDEGWYQEMVANGTTKLRDFGRYLGQRYSKYSNILWVHGGDYNPPDKSLVRAVALGIIEFDASALHTAHCAPETTALGFWSGESWLQLDTVYTYNNVHTATLGEYQNTQMPVFLIESRYENENMPEGTAQRTRIQAYHALLSGGTGQIFGNNPVWHFSGPGVYPSQTTWQNSLNSRGSRSMTQLRGLLEPLAWWNLEPDSAHILLTGGLGSGQDTAVASMANDRKYAIVYVPSIRAVSLNLAQLAGPNVVVRWYDPSNGSFSTVAGSPYPNSGTINLQQSGNNSAGDSDWVLLLESTP
jgi:hypothetical protein